MATFKISAWDLAEALGLRYVGEEWDDGEYCYVRKFSFHGKEIVDASWRDEDVKESVAEELLLDIGKKLAGMI